MAGNGTTALVGGRIEFPCPTGDELGVAVPDQAPDVPSLTVHRKVPRLLSHPRRVRVRTPAIRTRLAPSSMTNKT